MRAPLFWKDKTLLSTLLLPSSVAYRALSCLAHAMATPRKVPARVICIGNLVAGGAGKTPVALALGNMLKRQGRKAHYLSRGYKSANRGVTQVDVAKHSAKDVGDEPLLLAEVLPAWVARDRVAGAQAAIRAGADIIIMDDGFQNPSLHKDASVLVVDGHYGFGNERLIPAGPLREPVAQAMQRVSAVVLIGDDKHGVLRYVPGHVPVFRAEIRPADSAAFLKEKQVVAFCGIAHPRKFYRTLQSMGCSVRKYVSYPDHYHFTPKDLRFLRDRAKGLDAVLVTTEKDYVRLPDDMRAEVSAVPIELVLADAEAFLNAVLA